MKAKKLLWVDNDDPERYLSETMALEELGWQIAWATDLTVAAEQLANEVFAFVLLDQAFTHDGGPQSEHDDWAGCRLLYWLREMEQPSAAPPPEPELLRQWQPHQGNRDIPVCMVTGIYRDEIEESLRSSFGEKQWIIRKPIAFQRLREFLDQIEDQEGSVI